MKVTEVEWVPLRDEDALPPGWWMSDRGPVAPASGRVYDFIPSGYELADLEYLESFLDALMAHADA